MWIRDPSTACAYAGGMDPAVALLWHLRLHAVNTFLDKKAELLDSEPQI